MDANTAVEAASRFLMRAREKMECAKARARGVGHRPACLRARDKGGLEKSASRAPAVGSGATALSQRPRVTGSLQKVLFILFSCFLSFKCRERGQRELSFKMKTRFVNP